jgi:hypothetical protein
MKAFSPKLRKSGWPPQTFSSVRPLAFGPPGGSPMKLLKLPNHRSKPQGFRPSERSLVTDPRFFRRPPQPLNFRGPASPVLQPAVALRRPIWARPSARGRSRHGAAARALGVRALDSLGSAPYLTPGPPRARRRPPGAASACLAPKPPPPVDLKI